MEPSQRGSHTRVLMYHHIYENGAQEPLGRRSYAISLSAFDAHLDAFLGTVGTAPSTSLVSYAEVPQWAITFDDGAESALPAADLLESAGWRAYFFIVGSWIGNRGFLNAAQITDLRNRGHVIGSHSFSHPDPMSGLPYASMLEEWRRSLETLGEVLGEPIRTAAVPGGGYSLRVAAAAAEAGIEVLFTSEPVSRSRSVQGCTVVGRYAIRSSTDGKSAAALAAGRRSACTRQWLEWNCMKIPKRLLGNSYYTVRTRILSTGRTKRR